MINIEDLDVAGQPEHIAPEEYVVPTSQAGPRECVPTARYSVKLTDGKLKGDGNDRYPIVYRLIGQPPNQALEVQFAVKIVGGEYDGRLVYVRQTTFTRTRKVKVSGVDREVKSNEVMDIIRAIGNKSDITTYSGYVEALAAGIAAEAAFSGWIDVEVWDKASGYKLKGAKNFPLDENGKVMTTFECPTPGPDGVHSMLSARNTLAFASPLKQ